jgi:3-deoxy-7-phosphoheptulonate synthase
MRARDPRPDPAAHLLAEEEEALPVDPRGIRRKDWRRQSGVAQDIGEQVAQGDPAIFGIMMESFLVEGRQSVAKGTPLVYGQSITDACMDWETTVPLIHELAAAMRSGRAQAVHPERPSR